MIERLALENVPGEGAIQLERLGTGLVNESYRVRRDGRCYSLRVPTARSAMLGVDREWECRVLALADAAGLAPGVERCDPRTGVLVMRWVPGRIWTPEEVRHAHGIRQIAELIRRIHALPMPEGACTSGPAAWILHYRRALALVQGGGHRVETPPGDCAPGAVLETSALGNLALGNLADALTEHLARYAELPAVAPVLCHSDLHVHNLVVTGQGLVLLDWEYAHASEPLWDLAGWIVNNEFDAASALALIEAYLGRPPHAAESARLRLLVWLYGYLCVAWIELYLAQRALHGSASEQASEPQHGQGLAAHARALMGRLRRR